MAIPIPMNTIYNCTMSSAALPPPPPPSFHKNRTVHFSICLEFRHIFHPNHHGYCSRFRPLLGAAVVPRPAFFAAPAAVLQRLLSALGVCVPPSALHAFTPRLLSFSWSVGGGDSAGAILPLSFRIVAVTHTLTLLPGPYNVAPRHQTATTLDEDEKVLESPYDLGSSSSLSPVDDDDDDFMVGVVPAMKSFIEAL